MTLTGKRILILLGGQWHDFEAFAENMRALLEPQGAQLEATYDLDRLLQLADGRYDIVLSYTCLSPRREGNNPNGPERLTDAQVAALVDWVRAGGGLLALHAATVIGESDPTLGQLIGGVFLSHPPQFAFTVYPIFGEHPITAGIEAFTVHDEFYVERHTPEVDLHLVAFDRGIAYPMAWSKREGRGRVAHLAPGHSEPVWKLEAYQRLVLQALEWLMRKEEK